MVDRIIVVFIGYRGSICARFMDVWD